MVDGPDRSRLVDRRVPARTIRPVSRQARHDRTPPDARVAIGLLELPDLQPGPRDRTSRGAGPGRRRRAARQTRLNIRWEATDPNDDELSFSLKVRKEGWPEWIGLSDDPITERSFAWDTTAFPSGTYRLKLIATDRLSNNRDDAQTRDRESIVFLVDHDPPEVAVTPEARGAVVVLKDRLTRLVKADYSIDGGPWTPIFPDDGLFDTLRERISLSVPDLKPGTHVLMVRATDSAGNIGSGDALIRVGGPDHQHVGAMRSGDGRDIRSRLVSNRPSLREDGGPGASINRWVRPAV